MKGRVLELQQLDSKILMYKNIQKVASPPVGWIKAVRKTIGMSMQQLADRLKITRQSVQEMEVREQNGSITLNALRATAKAMDMQLVYGFVPIDGSLDELIERKAKELATQIVRRASVSMALEAQENSQEYLEKAIEERAAIFKKEIPKILWD